MPILSGRVTFAQPKAIGAAFPPKQLSVGYYVVVVVDW